MNEKATAAEAAHHISAASEERFIASTEEFASKSSKATVFFANVIQHCWSRASFCGYSTYLAKYSTSRSTPSSFWR